MTLLHPEMCILPLRTQKHFAALFGIQHHSLVDFGGGCFAAGVEGDGGVAGSIDLNVVLANPDGVAVVERGAFDAEIVDEGTVEAVEIFDDQAAGFKIDASVVIGYGQVVHGQIVVG